jgi:hypothetical protein
VFEQEVVVTPHASAFKDVYIITDLMDTDLHRKTIQNQFHISQLTSFSHFAGRF